MKWLVRVYWGVAGAALAAAVAALVLPSRVRVESVERIERPPATVYTLLSRTRTQREWVPWTRWDPDAEFRFDGPEFGEGARMAWRSQDPRVASGAQAITFARPHQRLEMAMSYDRWGRARGYFDITPQGSASLVAWGFETSFGLDVVRRIAGVGFPARIAADQARGLRELKALAESLPAADFADAGIDRVETDPVFVVYAAGRVRGDLGAHAEALRAALAQARAFMREQGLSEAGDPRAIFLRWEPPLWEFKAAIPYAGAPRAPSIGGAIGFEGSYAGPALRVVHRGPADRTAGVYAQLEAYRAAHRLEPASAPWEVLVTDRTITPPEEQVTEIYVPVR
ncbi:MAG: SRPBCC family protein [Caulobacterales bacterium]|nr:SRPBCC family protein [Caulobacterales bacterium]